MKTKLLISFLLVAITSFSQITLVNSFSNISSIGKYHQNNETFYFSETDTNNQIKIYDHTFSVIKIVNFATPNGFQDAQFIILDQPFFVTKNVFTQDNKFVFPTFFSNGSIQKLQLIDEDGNVVKDFGNNNYSQYIFEVFYDEKTNSNKLILHNRGTDSIDIYDLQNSATLNTQSFSKPSNIKVFPNPTSSKFTIIDSEKTISNGVIYNSSGKLIRKFSMNKKSFEKEIDLTPNNNGVYLIKAGNTTTKIIKE